MHNGLKFVLLFIVVLLPPSPKYFQSMPVEFEAAELLDTEGQIYS